MEHEVKNEDGACHIFDELNEFPTGLNNANEWCLEHSSEDYFQDYTVPWLAIKASELHSQPRHCSHPGRTDARDVLASLNLKEGRNTITSSFSTVKGKQQAWLELVMCEFLDVDVELCGVLLS
ncbi:hypothetical protein JHK87_039405 [Glycine soja]|nr:hypothetical protein JHK87_039405 [Glycine soja]